MGKISFWIFVIIAGLLIARLLARQNEKNNLAARRPKQAAPQALQPESMVRCAHCGIHMPRSEAVLTNGQTWCSTEHAKLGVRL